MITINTDRINNDLNKEVVRTERIRVMKTKCDEMLPVALQQIEPLLKKCKIEISETSMFFTDKAESNSFNPNRIAIRAVLKFKEKYATYDNFKVSRLNTQLQIATSSLLSVRTDGRDVSILFDSEKFTI